MSRRTYSRRGVLSSLASGGLGLGLFPVISTLLERRAQAATKPQYFIFAYFSGGWDQLLALDPRDGTLPQFRKAQAYAQTGSGIDVAYERLTDSTTRSLLASNPTGIWQPSGSNLTFGVAVPDTLLAHAPSLSVVRGINMETLTHEVGRRYFITGQFPRGLEARGSGLPTAVVGQTGDLGQLGNLTMGVETYNEDYPAFASGIPVLQASDVSRVLRVLGNPLTGTSDQAVQAYEAQADSCAAREEDATGLVQLFRSSRKKVRQIVTSGLSAHFNFTTDPTQQTAEIRDLFNAFGITPGTDLEGPLGQAALAGQVLTLGVSTATSLLLASNIDHHDSQWASDHAPRVRAGFDALGRLISFLKGTSHPAGGTFWNYTTLLCFSEFARTPLVNGRGGRDHHLASSCLLGGAGIKGNVVVGGTSDVGLAARNVNPTTGQPDDNNGLTIRPTEVHATVLAAMGLSDTYLASQMPQKLPAVLTGP